MIKLDKFKELLSVPSKTYKEELMVNYLLGELVGDGIKVTTDDHKNIYITKGTLSENEFYPMFVAHTDTVHEIIPRINVELIEVVRPNTFGKSFGDQPVFALKGYDDNNNPTGIGGDDKCGIFICLNLLEKLDKVKIGFFKM